MNVWSQYPCHCFVVIVLNCHVIWFMSYKWVAGSVLCVAGSNLSNLGSTTQILHYRPEETRHKRNKSLIASYLQRALAYGELGASSPTLWNEGLSWKVCGAVLGLFSHCFLTLKLQNTFYQCTIHRMILKGKAWAISTYLTRNGPWESNYDYVWVAINLRMGRP
jgi:hypothetical protein